MPFADEHSHLLTVASLLRLDPSVGVRIVRGKATTVQSLRGRPGAVREEVESAARRLPSVGDHQSS